MASSGRRLGLLLLAIPIALLVLWLEWDIRIAEAAAGVLMAHVLFGASADGDTQPTPALLLAYAIGGFGASLLAAFLVQSISDDPVGLYGISTITSDSRLLRKLSHTPVVLAAFAFAVLVRFTATALSSSRKSDT